MKKKQIAVAIILGTLTVTNVVGPIAPMVQQVYAAQQETQKLTAFKQTAKISINGKALESVVCFNLNGTTYYRIVDLAKMLNIDVLAIKNGGKNAIQINSAKGFNMEVNLPDIADTTDYNQRNLILFYDTYGANVDSIMYNGNNYVGLRSFVEASIESDKGQKEFVPILAGQKRLNVTPFPTVVKLTIEPGASLENIKITTSKVDYQALFEQAYKKSTGKDHKEAYIAQFGADTYKEYFGDTVTTSNTNTNVGTGTGTTNTNTGNATTNKSKVVATKPEVGTFPAKVLIDPNKPLYVNGDPDNNKLTAPYVSSTHLSPVGQCVWYAGGRFEEVLGVKYPEGASVYDLDEAGKNTLLSASKNTNDVLDNSIATFGTTHVVFVEYVERDGNGKPVNVYFTEANAGKIKGEEGKYTPGFDGKVKMLSFQDFGKRGVLPYKGCITLK